MYMYLSGHSFPSLGKYYLADGYLRQPQASSFDKRLVAIIHLGPRPRGTILMIATLHTQPFLNVRERA